MRATRFGVVAATVLVAGLWLTTHDPAVQAQGSSARPIAASDFSQHAPRGFDDRHNTWAQTMTWWRGRLYVGTARESACGSLYAVHIFGVGFLGQALADTFLPYPPPPASNLDCPLDGADLSLQAEIWSWAPETDQWTRLFQSPLELDNPGIEGFPPIPGKKLPYDAAIRGMTAHIEPDGTEALYAFGVNTALIWNRNLLPPPRVLRTTDGVNWAPVPQTPGTFLGDLPFNPDHSSFRSAASLNGKLFVLSGPAFGQGALIGSADPAKGDNAWFLASPSGLTFYEVAVFNGWLYLGTFEPFGGYSVVKTRAEGTPPYQFVTVVPRGAGLAERPSKSVVSMHEYNGRLYVGTATQTELIRINPDDTWELVIGPPREVATATGTEWKYPISGLGAGFGHSLNDHVWQMDDPFRELYMGTYNAASASKNHPVNGPLLAHNMGAHLYRTKDGYYINAITTNGFSNPNDPQGGPFDYGIRTMALTSKGFFLGTSNDSHGLGIFRATTRSSTAPPPPEQVDVEQTRNGGALVSWRAATRAERYQVWRADVNPIFVRDELNFELWNGALGNKIPDTYIGPYTVIGTTRDTAYLDTTVQPGKRYMYYVVQLQRGLVSDQSNLVGFPLLRPAQTFAQLLEEVDRWQQRVRYRNGATSWGELRQRIIQARTQAASCALDAARTLLDQTPSPIYLFQPEVLDLRALLQKLSRRVHLFNRFLGEVVEPEFCGGQNAL